MEQHLKSYNHCITNFFTVLIIFIITRFLVIKQACFYVFLH